MLISGRIPFKKASEIRGKEGSYVLVKGRLERETVTLLNTFVLPRIRLEIL